MIGEKYKAQLRRIVVEILNGNYSFFQTNGKFACYICGKNIGKEGYVVKIEEEKSADRFFLDRECLEKILESAINNFAYFSLN